ncbi:family 43 glycosylhydrolase [Paenibacillus hexagrammi]|uniref:Family 43 glycosylhydrolase n=1 Tax=Paenibacillus hexagrammi TaxID=2908839 RepID=A0ABY3SNT8_9BACL|nr:family 43 glycosylhydrolase [Paenibacillus sp. YPD9-1]UJF34881.1 family 43 glycosylhydrolase [Paenibacillus sp. YPD9-1]
MDMWSISVRWTLAVIGLSLLVLLLSSCQKESKRVEIEQLKNGTLYSNPMELSEEWEDYGIGDPFVMRYNGMYYLYCSTQDRQVGVKAWSSPDLVHWKPEGLVTEDPVTQAAYAPEVVYWNGYFYMYTSPGGGGHYVLRSESPTGPFTVQTGNLGMSIDGSVFIDDDGKWYFTHASDQGIVANEMSDPYTFGNNILLPGVFLQHWTEGSMIMKRNGKYVITYTGNHVFSTGYRIQYSVSDQGPHGPYRTPENNPFVISTEDEFNGLGHSSTVIGPDLDSYYLVYHNLLGASTSGPPLRKMNIDRLQFNGDRMSLQGPTFGMQRPAAKMPDYSVREVHPGETEGWKKERSGDRQFILTEQETEPVFTAEYNVYTAKQSEASIFFGTVFSYEGSKQYWAALINPTDQRLSVVRVEDGQRSEMGSAKLPADTDFTKLHTVRIENRSDSLHVFWDNMHKVEVKRNAAGGRIGYISSPSDEDSLHMQFTAYSNDAGGSSDTETAKPIPGVMEAVHYLKDDQRGYSLSGVGHQDGLVPERRGITTDDGSYAVSIAKAGDWLQYDVQVKRDGAYGIDFDVQRSGIDTRIEIQAGESKEQFTITKSTADNGKWEHLRLGSMHMNEGFAHLKVTLLDGSLTYRSMNFYASDEVFAPIENVPKSMVGMWVPEGGGYQTRAHEYIKTFTGSEDWTDYRVESELEFPTDPENDAGILFRTVHESYYPHQVPDAFTGYYARVNQDGLTLVKVNYGVEEILKSVPLQIQVGRTYNLTVEAKGNAFKIYWDGQPEPVIDDVDPRAYTHGKIGLLSNHSDIIFRQVRAVEAK